MGATTMSTSGSYRIAQVAADIGVELDRLRAQVDLFWPKEFRHYVDAGLRDGMQVLDAGSGPGYVTVKVLERLPNCRVVALEQDALLVEKAQALFSERGLGVTTLEASLLDSGLADDSFDFAIVRLVLEHLPDPVAGAREILRVLKPGGRAVFVDNDFDLYTRTHPPVPALSRFFQAYCECREAQGGHPRIGRRLPPLLRQAGYQNVDIDSVVAHSTVVGDSAFAASEGLGIPLKLVQDGYMTSADLGDLAKQWRDMLRTEGHVVFRQLLICTGEK